MSALLPWFGGKIKTADWIRSHFPGHHTYVEPFGGAMAVLLAKPPSPVEVYNDVDQELVNFWRVVRDPVAFEQLRHRIELTPYARAEWRWARGGRGQGDPVERAARWWTVIRQGFSATDTSWSFTVDSTARGMSRETSKYLAAIEMLPQVHARISRVQIDCLDWREMFARYDRERTLFYCDPPYVMATRRNGGYAHELSDDDHRDLVERALAAAGMVVISGYAHELYRPLERAGWSVVRREVPCHAAGRTRANGMQGPGSAAHQVRTESLWISPRAVAGEAQMRLVDVVPRARKARARGLGRYSQISTRGIS